jgi:hypothetical protein
MRAVTDPKFCGPGKNVKTSYWPCILRRKWKGPQKNFTRLLQFMPSFVGIVEPLVPKYCGPYIISRVIPPSTYEVSTTSGKVRGEFNKKALKPYLEEETSCAVDTN